MMHGTSDGSRASAAAKNDNTSFDTSFDREIGQMRERVLKIILWIALLAIVAQGLAIARSSSAAQLALALVQFAMHLALIVVLTLRKRLSFKTRASVAMILEGLVGLSGLYGLGLVAAGALLITLAGIINYILLERKYSHAYLASALVLIIAVGIGHANGLLTPIVDVDRFVVNIANWVLVAMNVGLIVGVVQLAVTSLLSSHVELIATLRQSRDELSRAHDEQARTARSIREMIRSANVAIFTLSSDRLVTDWNPEAAALTGVAREDAMGLPFADRFLTVPSPGEFDGAMQGVMEGKQLTNYELAISSAAGKEIDLLLSASRIYSDVQERDGLVCVAVDVTERKKLAAALQYERDTLEEQVEERTAELNHALKDLIRVSNAKDQFLATMSHELKTPLTAILGSSQLLLEGLAGEVTEKMAAYHQRIYDKGEQLHGLVQDILLVASMQTEDLPLSKMMVDVRPFLESVVRPMRQIIERKELSFTLDIEPEIGQSLFDPQQLGKAVSSLLDNAVKFTPAGRKIGVTASRDTGREQLFITVWDSGIGIDPSDAQLIFDPFVQIDSRLSREYEGIGLGLFLVDKIVDAHGGDVQVNSLPGKGSEFIIALPLKMA